MSEKKFDIILFGVTGLVGRYGLKNMFEITSKYDVGILWAVAGRNTTQIRQILKQLHTDTNDESILQTPVLFADMTDAESIHELVKQTKIVLNFCGPLRQLGEVVVKACIEHGTHYLDLSAEPNFIEKVQLDYDEEAKKAKIYVCNSCGFDSVAYEMGVIFLQENFNGLLNSVETYLRYGTDKHGLPGPDFNTSTWNSIIDLLANSRELKDLRKRQQNWLPVLTPKLQPKIVPFRPKVEEGWAVPSPSADLSVMLRTQQYIQKETKKRPIQIASYFMFTNIFHIIFFVISGAILLTFSKFQWGRNMLFQHPSFFTGGVFGGEEPKEEKLDNNWCSLTLVGKGWERVEDHEIREPDTEIVARIKGYNTGYNLTSLCLVLSGVLLMVEPQNFPRRKGVLTPGVLLSGTTLIQKLHENGLKFELVGKKTLRGKYIKNKL
ncbi:saccharopine dehydrogenase-like oxidoreductase [Coccinella septempunctata]|uniref:saccharopine dehydrogenase-like oxidoreductase n=1 Tax=Coccinella septempunctata TaxID=41139 RepID=UPI001D07DC7A|nr:saccharopine dehydrogenase-like oxidoreductase [Coccinella septempunctata]